LSYAVAIAMETAVTTAIAIYYRENGNDELLQGK
jgi:hypothetical protein